MLLILGASAVVLTAMIIVGPSQSLDARLYYDPMEAWSFFVSLTPEQTGRYFVNELLDLVFIFLYSSFLYLSFQRLTGWKKSLCQIGYLPGAFDLVETTWILSTLKTGNISGPILWMGTVTFLKWASGAAVIGVLAFASLRRRLQERRSLTTGPRSTSPE
jgi:hypothetical protein